MLVTPFLKVIQRSRTHEMFFYSSCMLDNKLTPLKLALASCNSTYRREACAVAEVMRGPMLAKTRTVNPIGIISIVVTRSEVICLHNEMIQKTRQSSTHIPTKSIFTCTLCSLEFNSRTRT